MSQNNNQKKFDDGKDTVVTTISLIVIVVQSLIIILGFTQRWDWLMYECAAMLIIPAAIVLGYGIKGIIDADKLMSAGLKESETAGKPDTEQDREEIKETKHEQSENQSEKRS